MMVDVPVHEIKPLLDVDVTILDTLFLIFILIFASFLLKFLLHKKRIKRENIKKEQYKKLKNINFSDAKQAAYDITYYGSFFDSNIYQELVKNLEEYKYKKSVNQIDKETKRLYKTFLKSITIK